MSSLDAWRIWRTRWRQWWRDHVIDDDRWVPSPVEVTRRREPSRSEVADALHQRAITELMVVAAEFRRLGESNMCRIYEMRATELQLQRTRHLTVLVASAERGEA